MPRNVTMAVHLPASAARLYRMYLDPKQHAAFTGAPVKIAARGRCCVHGFRRSHQRHGPAGGSESPDRASWRSKMFGRGDLDSTLVLTFWPEKAGGRIELIHVNVADRDFAGVSEGWSKYYWQPWRQYLTAPHERPASGN